MVPCDPNSPTLRLNDRGPLVENLRRILQQRGLYSGALDGIFGSQTQSAVMAFQRANGLTVDGIVGPNTWRALCS
jgi:peptidoglycan hydrolase-like protein with peptidoglycan-binding domain